MEKFADIHVHMTDLDFGKCEAYLDLLAEQKVTDVALQSLTYRSIAYNLAVLYWKDTYQKLRLSAFGMVHNEDFYKEIPFEVQAQALLAMGCDGIKMMYAPSARKRLGYGVDDARYDKLFTHLEEHGIPIVIHVNDPEEYWKPRELSETERARGWGYFDGTFLSKQEIYDETFRMLDRHPRLRVIFAHFFFLSNDIDEATRVMETYPNVHFDLTPGWEMFLGFSKDIDAWQAFFEKYAHRILFGTDCNDNKNINPQIYQLVRMAISHDKTEFKMPAYRDEYIKGLDLSKGALEKITYQNYARLVGEPRQVDRKALLSAARRLLVDIGGSTDEAFRKAADFTCEMIARYEK